MSLSITNSKPLTNVLWILYLVDHGHGVILDRNATHSVCISEQLIRAKTELAGALSRGQVGRQRQEGPFKAWFVAQHVQGFAGRKNSLVIFRREFWEIHGLDARLHFQAARATDEE